MSLQPHLLVCLCSSNSIHLHQQPQSPSLACYISIPRSLFPISYDLDTALSTLNCPSPHVSIHMSSSLYVSPAALYISISTVDLYGALSILIFRSLHLHLSVYLSQISNFHFQLTHPPSPTLFISLQLFSAGGWPSSDSRPRATLCVSR